MRTRSRSVRTEFNGVEFLSMLEAEWALRWATLGVAYRYEAVRIKTETQAYTPDFILPKYRAFIEIKPNEPTDDEFLRSALGCDVLGGWIFVVTGRPCLHTIYAPRMVSGKWVYGITESRHLPFPV